MKQQPKPLASGLKWFPRTVYSLGLGGIFCCEDCLPVPDNSEGCLYVVIIHHGIKIQPPAKIATTQRVKHEKLCTAKEEEKIANRSNCRRLTLGKYLTLLKSCSSNRAVTNAQTLQRTLVGQKSTRKRLRQQQIGVQECRACVWVVVVRI